MTYLRPIRVGHDEYWVCVYCVQFWGPQPRGPVDETEARKRNGVALGGK